MDTGMDLFLAWAREQVVDVDRWRAFFEDVKHTARELSAIAEKGPVPENGHPFHPRLNRVLVSFDVIGMDGDPKRLEVELPDPCVLRGLPGLEWSEVLDRVMCFAQTELVMRHDALADPGNPANPFGYRGELVRRFRDGETPAEFEAWARAHGLMAVDTEPANSAGRGALGTDGHGPTRTEGAQP